MKLGQKGTLQVLSLGYKTPVMTAVQGSSGVQVSAGGSLALQRLMFVFRRTLFFINV